MGVTSLGPAIVSKIDGTVLIGPHIAAESIPVTMATDQPAIPIVVSGSVSTKPASLASAGAGQFGLSVASTGAVTALTVPPGATSAQITVSGANIRYRDDGTDPTTTVGMPVYQASSWFYSGPLSAIKFYAQSGTATLDVLFYK